MRWPWRRRPCDHQRNWTERRTLLGGDTPVVSFHCDDCGATDHGHVYADPSGWAGTTVCRNGVKEESA